MKYFKISRMAMLLTLPLLFLNACADYRFTMNDTVIYTPGGIFRGYTIADEGLRNCIAQTIEDRKISRAVELVELNCSYAGVASLEGIHTFHGLELLILSNNQVTDLSALFDLQSLGEVHLDGNTQLPCQQLANVQSRPGVHLVKPEQCE